ncbi:MAG: hypothetical protein Q9166_005599 [cf. Caloplaca sp. 2 TL-2023]
MTTPNVCNGQYSKCGRPFLLHEPSLRKEIMLPPEHIKWFSNQPDSSLSSAEIRKERHAVRYLHVGVDFNSTVFFLERFIGESLAKKLDMLQKPMYEEIRHNTDKICGVDETEWKTINVYNSLQEIILPAMSRVFFGLPLSHDPKFLTSFRRYVLAMGVGTIVIGQLPRYFKGLLVPLFNVPLWYYREKTMKELVPMIERQLVEIRDTKTEVVEEKYDLVSQSARVATKLSGIRDVVDSTSNILLDVVCCSPEMQTYEILREEAAALLKSDDDWNNPATFKKFVLADSTIRESLRFHPILIKGLTKEVVHPDGLKLPDGTHIPRGGWLGIPVLGLHMDDRFYPNPQDYDPFRCARMKQDRVNAQRRESLGEGHSYANTNDLDAGQPTSTYVGFGYGRHACPGRWFAVQLLKILLAYLTMNYDIESTGPQPKARVIGDAALPPTSASVRVRRKKQPNGVSAIENMSIALVLYNLIHANASSLLPLFLTTALLLGLTMVSVSLLALYRPSAFAQNFGVPLSNFAQDHHSDLRENIDDDTTYNDSGIMQDEDTRTIPSEVAAADPVAWIVIFSGRELALGTSLLAFLYLKEYRALSILVLVISVVAVGDSLATMFYGSKGRVEQHAWPGAMIAVVGIFGWVLCG